MGGQNDWDEVAGLIGPQAYLEVRDGNSLVRGPVTQVHVKNSIVVIQTSWKEKAHIGKDGKPGKKWTEVPNSKDVFYGDVVSFVRENDPEVGMCIRFGKNRLYPNPVLGISSQTNGEGPP